jgi:hypothetical protein
MRRRMRRRLRHVESKRAESGTVLLLTAEERTALLRVIHVVEDNWWLDEVERDVLERIEQLESPVAPGLVHAA